MTPHGPFTVTLRATGVLGDADVSTSVTRSGPNPGIIAAGSLTITAGAMRGQVDPGGTITSMRVGGNLQLTDTESRTSGWRFRYDLPAAAGNVLATPQWAIDIQNDYHAAAQTVRPDNGQPFTFSDLLGITNLGAECDYVLDGSELTRLGLLVAEMYIEVTGTT